MPFRNIEALFVLFHKFRETEILTKLNGQEDTCMTKISDYIYDRSIMKLEAKQTKTQLFFRYFVLVFFLS